MNMKKLFLEITAAYKHSSTRVQPSDWRKPRREIFCDGSEDVL